MSGSDLAARAVRFDGDQSSSARFDQLVKEREMRRRLYETTPHALPLVGTCQDMCPEYERYEREVHLDLSPFEMVPGTEKPITPGDHPRIDHGRAVKKYHRPAAGNEAPLPEDVRPAPVLLRTMAYLVNLIDSTFASSGLEGFAQVQKFVRDRTRSIRQDATLQNLRLDHDSLIVHQQIARFHILSGHRLCELPKTDFDAFQNTEQLRKVLQSLNEFYLDIRAAGLTNILGEEAEFRAYYLLTHLEDPDVFRRCFGWAPEVLGSPSVQFALSAGGAFHQGDYIQFFSLIKSRPANMSPTVFYLCCCLLHSHFSAMRRKTSLIFSKAYGVNETLPVNTIGEWLAFTDEAELMEFVEACECPVVRPKPSMWIGRPAAVMADVKPRRNDRFIEAIVAGIPMSQIILNTAASLVVPSAPIVVNPPIKLIPPMPVPLQKPVVQITEPPKVQNVPIAISKAPPPVTMPIPAKRDWTDVASVMLDNLLTTHITGMVQSISHTLCEAHNQRVDRMESIGSDLLSSILDDILLDISASALYDRMDRQEKQLALLIDNIYSSLRERVIQETVQRAAFESAVQQRKTFEPDPLEAAYERGIFGAKRPFAQRIVVQDDGRDQPSPMFDDLRERVRREQAEADRFEAYLKSLL